MDPLPPRAPPPPDHGHPAPSDGWRPISGLCLAAFVLALALSLLSVLSLWAGLLLPLALGLIALATVDGTRFRGRALAWWAVGISAVVGSLSLFSTLALNERMGFFANAVLSALRSERPPEERQSGLEAWLATGPKRDEVRVRIEERYRQAVARLGPPKGQVLLPSIWSGQFPLMIPPGGVVAVDDPTDLSTLPAPGAAVWVRVPFERGEGHLALWVGDGSVTGLSDAFAQLAEDRAVPIVRDARFYAPAALLGEAPTVPKDR